MRNGDGGKTKTLKMGKTKTVFFSLLAPHAHHVSVAGDFNGWDTKSHPMEKNKFEVWRRSVVLAPGYHEYRFVVDGAWQNDPQNVESVPNPFGTLNNVKRVRYQGGVTD